MSAATTYEDDDPVIASYDVHITGQTLEQKDSETRKGNESRLFVLQYPSHRSFARPYNEACSQKPSRLRLKSKTGMVEMNIPILTQNNFNTHAGEKYGQALLDSRVSQLGSGHGLAGGFASGPLSTQTLNLNDIPMHEDQSTHLLTTQTLGGKIVAPCERDPIYMLGSLHDNRLHLTRLDAVIQMRPQLHHIDAEEEIGQKRFQAAGSTSKTKAGIEAGLPKLESKAIEIKLKDNKEDLKDRALNTNAQLLRDIQADQWQSHDWVDEDDEQSWLMAEEFIGHQSAHDEVKDSVNLRSSMSNDEWLDKMSVPRAHGKKGLRAKLKGRDRERARRKKVESQRRQTDLSQADNIASADVNSDSELSSLSEQSSVEGLENTSILEQKEVKQEFVNPSSASSATLPMSIVPATDVIPKKRGRPKKS